jgi:DnaJ-class molecular chaperone
VEFRGHPLYRVVGADIHLDLPVTPWEAALGASDKAPTPSGVVNLTIPANSKQGRKLRLEGRGLGGKQAGDLYVVPATDLAAGRQRRCQDAVQTDGSPTRVQPTGRHGGILSRWTTTSNRRHRSS